MLSNVLRQATIRAPAAVQRIAYSSIPNPEGRTFTKDENTGMKYEATPKEAAKKEKKMTQAEKDEGKFTASEKAGGNERGRGGGGAGAGGR